MIKQVLIGMMLIVGLGASANTQEKIKLGTANTVTFRGVVDEVSTQKAALELYRLSEIRGDKPYPIYLVMDSPGGSIEDGEAFIELVKSIPNVKTITVFAASMASAIVEGLPGERLIIDSGVLMFHRAKGGIQGQFETGEMESRLEFYKKYVRRMERRNSDRMGMTLKFYKSLVKDELWMTSGDALGVSADKVASIECSKALREKSESVNLDLGIISISLSFSACPLFRSPIQPKSSNESEKKAYEQYKSEYKSIFQVRDAK